MSDYAVRREQSAVVRGVISRAAGLPEQDIVNFEDFVEHDEEELAFEILCDQLYEYAVALSAEDIRTLEKAGGLLGVDKNYTDLLWEHVAGPAESLGNHG